MAGVADEHGNPTTGTSDAVARYDKAVNHLLGYRNDFIDAMNQLLAEDPGFPMGVALAGYMSLTSTDTPDVAGAGEMVAQLGTLALNEREDAHRSVLATWHAGDWHGAARQLDHLLIRWPADLLALLVGHQLDFFVGDAANLRDRIARSLPSIDPNHPHHGYVRGMFAFGLEESGHYQQAEQHGLAALERNGDDVWANHAVTHVYEMQGRVDEGIDFLQTREATWAHGNLFSVHNWWHLALFALEAGRTDKALSIYDSSVHNDQSIGVPLEMLDASALLWRLLIDGADTGNRFGPLADAWATRTEFEPWYVFNDLHAVMAFAGAGRLDNARAITQRLHSYAKGEAAERSNVQMAREVGIPACEAVIAYAEDRYADVVALLSPVRSRLARFGGSHAQRDALQRTLLQAALHAGDTALARALINERLALRETSVWSWSRQADLLRQTGDERGAERARRNAGDHMARFAAALG